MARVCCTLTGCHCAPATKVVSLRPAVSRRARRPGAGWPSALRTSTVAVTCWPRQGATSCRSLTSRMARRAELSVTQRGPAGAVGQRRLHTAGCTEPADRAPTGRRRGGQGEERATARASGATMPASRRARLQPRRPSQPHNPATLNVPSQGSRKSVGLLAGQRQGQQERPRPARAATSNRAAGSAARPRRPGWRSAGPGCRC